MVLWISTSAYPPPQHGDDSNLKALEKDMMVPFEKKNPSVSFKIITCNCGKI
jgi:hypothetical protein